MNPAGDPFEFAEKRAKFDLVETVVGLLAVVGLFALLVITGRLFLS